MLKRSALFIVILALALTACSPREMAAPEEGMVQEVYVESARDGAAAHNYLGFYQGAIDGVFVHHGETVRRAENLLA